MGTIQTPARRNLQRNTPMTVTNHPTSNHPTSNYTVASVFESLDTARAAASRRAEIIASISELRAELDTIEAVLRDVDNTTRVVNGVPLHIDDTTAHGGIYIKIHPITWNRSRRAAEVCTNHRTGEWMLSISGAECRSGGDIIEHGADKDALVEAGCAWVANGR